MQRAHRPRRLERALGRALLRRGEEPRQRLEQAPRAAPRAALRDRAASPAPPQHARHVIRHDRAGADVARVAERSALPTGSLSTSVTLKPDFCSHAAAQTPTMPAPMTVTCAHRDYSTLMLRSLTTLSELVSSRCARTAPPRPGDFVPSGSKPRAIIFCAAPSSQHLANRGVEPRDDVRRRARGRLDRFPGPDVEARHARLGDGGNIGRAGDALAVETARPSTCLPSRAGSRSRCREASSSRARPGGL